MLTRIGEIGRVVATEVRSAVIVSLDQSSLIVAHDLLSARISIEK